MFFAQRVATIWIKGNCSADLYQDTAEFSSGHRSHCPLEELERDIPEDLRKYVYCMHFTTDFTEKLKTMGFCQVMQPVKI